MVTGLTQCPVPVGQDQEPLWLLSWMVQSPCLAHPQHQGPWGVRWDSLWGAELLPLLHHPGDSWMHKH